MKQWYTSAELAALNLPDIPASKRGVNKLADAFGWSSLPEKTRKREGRGGGVEYHISLLPAAAQLRLKIMAEEQTPQGKRIEIAALWERYEKLSDKHKKTCEVRLNALHAVCTLEEAGFATTVAMEAVSRQNDISFATLYNWRSLTEGWPREDWLAALAPSFAATAQRSDCDPRAWEYFVSDYLRPEKPSMTSCYRRMKKVASKEGWSPVPSDRTLRRRVAAEINDAVITYARSGKDAAKALYPAQRRIRHTLHAMQAVNMDGHKLDVFVDVPWSETPVRMMLIALQDLYSGKFVGWRLSDSENWETVRLTIGDMVERYGIPDQIVMDNGRAFTSKWISGQTSNRFRFKNKPDDPQGLLTTLGVKIHWTQPYSGQSKPIERAFRDLADNIAKHPICAGAYTGNRPDAKPENYATRAIPLEEFRMHVDAQIMEHNAQEGRTSAACKGRSFDETFSASLAEEGTIVSWPTTAQKSLWLMASEAIRAKKGNGEINFHQNRYWNSALTAWAGKKVILRFDPDNLHKPILVYDLNNALICEADCVDDTGYFDQEESRRHNRKRKEYMRDLRKVVEAERVMSAEQLGEIYYRGTTTTKPQPEKPVVTRIATGNAALAVKHHEEERAEQIDFEANLERALKLIQGGLED